MTSCTNQVYDSRNHVVIIAVADPGFTFGGGGDMGLGGGHFSGKMYVKMKELGPVWGGGVGQACPLDPSMD